MEAVGGSASGAGFTGTEIRSSASSLASAGSPAAAAAGGGAARFPHCALSRQHGAAVRIACRLPSQIHGDARADDMAQLSLQGSGCW